MRLSYDFSIFCPLSVVLLGSNTACMLGKTPPPGIIAPTKISLSSSSLRTANCICRGVILCFLLARAVLPANSRISAARYSKTAVVYTEALEPMRFAYLPFFK